MRARFRSLCSFAACLFEIGLGCSSSLASGSTDTGRDLVDVVGISPLHSTIRFAGFPSAAAVAGRSREVLPTGRVEDEEGEAVYWEMSKREKKKGICVLE